MGSGYYGEMNIGSNNNNGLFSSNSGSMSRRKKKSSNSSNKAKQPQRGLGVAQLEKIRLHGQLGYTSYFPSNGVCHGSPYMSHHNLNYHQEICESATPIGSFYSFHQPNMMIGFSDMGVNLSTCYGHESQLVHYSQADYNTRPFFSSHDTEASRMNNNECDRSGSHDSGTSNTQQEVDLELRL